MKLFKVLRTLARVGLIAMAFYACFQLGTINGAYGLETTTYEWNAIREQPPPELLLRVGAYNGLHNTILYALGFLFLYLTFDYFADPKNHFITMFIERVKRLDNG